jgi:superfamily I DNA and/or RNA helicase
VLLTAFTNRAVDEICSKLDEAGIDYLRLGSDLSASHSCHPHLLSRRVDTCHRVADVRLLLKEARVVCATTASMCGTGLQLLSLRRFTLAIVDEASQLLEPHLLPLLSATTAAGEAAIGRFVLIGDHKQLPAVVGQNEAQSRVHEPELRGIGLTDCRRSLFERWLTAWQQSPRHVYMLTRQGRMHHDIALFPSHYFYEGRLEVASERQTAIVQEPRTTFIDTRRVEDEARLAASIVVDTWRRYGPRFDEGQTVGVIVPYRNQISAVRKWLPDALANVTIDTVERFQGSQRDVIVYSFSAAQRHQLQFLTSSVFEENGQVIDRKLNVAMTRAREHLYLIGNVPLLEENLTFSRLVGWMAERQCLVSAEEYLARHPSTL